jgi:nicotinamidase-related amidase
MRAATDPEPLALIVIDAQIEFLTMCEAGSADTCSAHAALQGIVRLVHAARAAGHPVIFTQELHRPELVDFGRELDGNEPVHCLEGAPGTELVDELRPAAGEWTIHKRRYSAFFATDLDLLLRGLGVRTIVVCGYLTDVCVHYTCVDAHQHDYRIRLVRDACAGSSAPASRATFAAVEYLQRDAIITSPRYSASSDLPTAVPRAPSSPAMHREAAGRRT